MSTSTRIARIARFAISATVVAALAACGGGGGGGGDDGGGTTADPVRITEANAPSVAAQAIDAGQAGFVGNALPVGVQVQAAGTRPATLAGSLRAATRLLREARMGSQLVGVQIDPFTVPCTGGGSVRFSGEVASENGLTVGDTLVLAFTDCVEEGVEIDGRLAFSITEVNADMTLLGVRAAATDFAATVLGITERVNGTLRMRFDETDGQTSRLDIGATRFDFDRVRAGSVRASRTLLDYDYLGVTTLATGELRESVAFSASGNFPRLGSVSFTVATTAPILTASGDEHPYAGAAVVTGANGTSVKLTVQPDGLRLDVDTNGDGSTDRTLLRTWAEIEAELEA